MTSSLSEALPEALPDARAARGFVATLAGLCPRRCYALAVSGGPDSMGMLALGAAAARLDSAPRFVVLTVDHGLSPQSATWAREVARCARELNLPARVLRWRGAKPLSAVQARARAARHHLLGEAAREIGTDALVLAHHKDDQAETVLARLAQGSGLAGLGGMAAVSAQSGIWRVRPFLDWDKQDLRAFAARANLPVVDDPANRNAKYYRARVRARADVLAELGLTTERLVAFARVATRAQTALAEATDDALAKLCTQEPSGLVRMAQAGFLALNEELALRVLARLVQRHAAAAYPVRGRKLESLREGLRSERQRGFSLAGTLVRRKGAEIWFTREPRAVADLEPVPLKKGEQVLWDGRFRVSAPAAGELAPLGAAGLAAAKADGVRPQAPASALVTSPALWRAGRLLASMLHPAPRHLSVQCVPLCARVDF